MLEFMLEFMLECLEVAVHRDFAKGCYDEGIDTSATRHALWLIGESTLGSETASMMGQFVGKLLGKILAEFIGQVANSDSLEAAVGTHKGWLG